LILDHASYKDSLRWLKKWQWRL